MDVKPDNIYTSSEGAYKLGDFGLATSSHSRPTLDVEEGDNRSDHVCKTEILASLDSMSYWKEVSETACSTMQKSLMGCFVYPDVFDHAFIVIFA